MVLEVHKILQDVVPAEEIAAWKKTIKRVVVADCPIEVQQFISALAAKLGDFAQIGKDHSTITGYELLLCGMSEINGEKIFRWDSYPLPIPRMIAVDHENAMHRIYQRKGRQGLIDFCKAKVKGTELERLLDNLNVNVFHVHREQYTAMMREINAADKIETSMSL